MLPQHYGMDKGNIPILPICLLPAKRKVRSAANSDHQPTALHHAEKMRWRNSRLQVPSAPRALAQRRYPPEYSRYSDHPDHIQAHIFQKSLLNSIIIVCSSYCIIKSAMALLLRPNGLPDTLSSPGGELTALLIQTLSIPSPRCGTPDYDPAIPPHACCLSRSISSYCLLLSRHRYPSP